MDTFHHQISKFCRVFWALPAVEMKEFRKLARLDLLGKKRDYSAILDILIGMAGKDTVIDNSGKVTADLITGTGLSKRTLWNRLSELNRISEYYFAMVQLKKNTTLRKKLTIDTLTEMKRADLTMQYVNPVLKTLESSKFSSESYLLNHQVISSLSSFFAEAGNSGRSAEYYRIQSDYSLAYFLLRYFESLYDFAIQEKNNFKRTRGLNEELAGFFNHTKVLSLIEKNHPEAYPMIEIYYSLYMSFVNEDGAGFYYRAKSILYNNSRRFDDDFKIGIFEALRNYCVDKTNSGCAEYYREIFELNNRILQDGLFAHMRKVDPRTNHFRNFVFAASRLNEFEWIKDFIKDYSGELSAETRDDEVNLASVVLFFYEKKFDIALEHLLKVKRKSYLHYLDTSVYKMMVYYEIAEFEESRKEVARLRDYIRQHKEIPAYLKGSYQRFLQKFALLIKLTDKPELEIIQVFKQ